MNKIKIGITMGDPAGVGPEVIIKAVEKLSVAKFSVNLLIIGDGGVLENYLHKFRLKGFLKRKNLELVDLKNVAKKNFKPGFSRPEYGRAALEYINQAITLLKGGVISTLVTAPVSKEMINRGGIKFFGHTEYLSSSFQVADTLMMLVNRYMRVVPLTRHIALKEVSPQINYSFLYKNIKLTAEYLRKFFSIFSPKIAICALNPHGGEGGSLGNEEKEVIIPLIEDLGKESTLRVSGPYSADGLFSHYKKNEYDCIIGMYHDQVMIPVKMIDPEHTVNITLGLPFIRTSPGHGTAFDIAGKGKASFSSMFSAIKLAYKLTQNAFSL
ncbi:MAG: 4-hydroxythreonine-4-phosphate dehydrogenase PdxA [Candidatus Omnitrophica bacterium]|nr:4-hydroxythreonine-4-phosphate dehydrogenase PdxA [Candidatus Omnitrophota bacterium]MCM8793451.1 4-hydroxythreonine-4-phosphate dehydrogenase PdxA [Candidatus Omnitrophota bacterium]